MGHGSSLAAEAGSGESHIQEQKGSMEVHTRGKEPVLEERDPWGAHEQCGESSCPRRMWLEGRPPVKRLASCGEGPREGGLDMYGPVKPTGEKAGTKAATH